jgi:hypothetical protein
MTRARACLQWILANRWLPWQPMQATGVPFLYSAFFAVAAMVAGPLPHYAAVPGLLWCWVCLAVQPLYIKIYFGVKRDLFADVLDLLDLHVATVLIAYIQYGDLGHMVSLFLGVAAACPGPGPGPAEWQGTLWAEWRGAPWAAGGGTTAAAAASGETSAGVIALVVLFGYMRHAWWVLMVQMGVRQAKPFVQELMHTEGTLEAEFMKQTLEADQRVFGPVMKNRGKTSHRGGLQQV